jgi:hypothetical protein
MLEYLCFEISNPPKDLQADLEKRADFQKITGIVPKKGRSKMVDRDGHGVFFEMHDCNYGPKKLTLSYFPHCPRETINYAVELASPYTLLLNSNQAMASK